MAQRAIVRSRRGSSAEPNRPNSSWATRLMIAANYQSGCAAAAPRWSFRTDPTGNNHLNSVRKLIVDVTASRMPSAASKTSGAFSPLRQTGPKLPCLRPPGGYHRRVDFMSLNPSLDGGRFEASGLGVDPFLCLLVAQATLATHPSVRGSSISTLTCSVGSGVAVITHTPSGASN